MFDDDNGSDFFKSLKERFESALEEHENRDYVLLIIKSKSNPDMGFKCKIASHEIGLTLMREIKMSPDNLIICHDMNGEPFMVARDDIAVMFTE